MHKKFPTINEDSTIFTLVESRDILRNDEKTENRFENTLENLINVDFINREVLSKGKELVISRPSIEEIQKYSHNYYECENDVGRFKILSIPDYDRKKYLEMLIFINKFSPINEDLGYYIEFNDVLKDINQYYSTHDPDMKNFEVIGKTARMITRLFENYLLENPKISISQDEREMLARKGLIEIGAKGADTGKVLVDSKILQKEGRLTKKEMDYIKNHPNDSVKISQYLISSNYLKNAFAAHHSRFDKSEDYDSKNLENRTFFYDIMMAADIITALSSPFRKYIKEPNHELFFDMLVGKNVDEKGGFEGHFNPVFVNFLLDCKTCIIDECKIIQDHYYNSN